jgi:hypothetical protein
VITRDLARAKVWVKAQTRGSEQYGLLASLKAMRLKPYAIDIRVSVDPVQWFLNDRSDVRSSWYLEDCATEFQVQGLKLDWTYVTWDGDFRKAGNGPDWSYHDFRGDRWTHIHQPENRNYLKNAYRVLLTRARQGMVVFVPPGDPEDPRRAPVYYDATWRYLEAAGLAVICSAAGRGSPPAPKQCRSRSSFGVFHHSQGGTRSRSGSDHKPARDLRAAESAISIERSLPNLSKDQAPPCWIICCETSTSAAPSSLQRNMRATARS